MAEMKIKVEVADYHIVNGLAQGAFNALAELKKYNPSKAEEIQTQIQEAIDEWNAGRILNGKV